MKVFLVFLQTLNGKLALDQNDDLSWGTKRDKIFFKEMSTKIGSMIMGYNTYLSLPKTVFKGKKTFVLTEIDVLPEEGIQFIKNKSPKEILNMIGAQGIEQVAVVGGGFVISQFISEDLIDEIFITIAPKIFGKGIESFKGDFKIRSLKLLEVTKFDDEVILHYEVLK